MGMALQPENGKQDLSYNTQGWRYLCTLVLMARGMELPHTNDGELINAAECELIAEAIEENWETYNEIYGGPSYGAAPAVEHAEWWRNSGGVRVH